MKKSFNRRSILKSGILTLAGLTALPQIRLHASSPLKNGAFSDMALSLDPENNIFRSPMVREYFLDDETPKPLIKARLNSNENPYGPPKSAQEAVIKSVVNGNRYSWSELSELVNKIATKESVETTNIMVGPGSSDLLEKVALVLFRSGKGNIVSADPTYMSLVNVAKSTGASWKAIPCKDDWSHDLDAMEAAIDNETKLVYLCNPNNPVGTITCGKKLLNFCSRVSEKVPVIVDEAYLELALNADTESMVSLISKNKNIIVARTFSKIMGMAGIRMGYIVAQPEFIRHIQKMTNSGMGISHTSIFAANASLDDHAFQEMTRSKNQEAKEYIYNNLKRLN